MSDYTLPDPLTRENFCDALIKSFALDRGALVKQALYFDYISEKTQVDCIGILADFIDAGAWDRFTPEEQGKFREYFNRVKAHTDEDTYGNTIAKQFDKNAASELEGTLKEIFTHFPGGEEEDREESFILAKQIILERTGKTSFDELEATDFLSQLVRLKDEDLLDEADRIDDQE